MSKAQKTVHLSMSASEPSDGLNARKQAATGSFRPHHAVHAVLILIGLLKINKDSIAKYCSRLLTSQPQLKGVQLYSLARLPLSHAHHDCLIALVAMAAIF